MKLSDLRGRRKNLSRIELRPESFDNPLELLAVPVKAGHAYELFLEVIGELAPDSLTIPMVRLYGAETSSNLFDMAPDDAGLITNSTTEGEPWAVGDYRRGLILESGVLHVSAWVADVSGPEVAPTNSLVIDQGILVIREI